MLILATNKQILAFWSRLAAGRREKGNEASAAATDEDEDESLPDSDEEYDVPDEICEDEFGEEDFLEKTEDRVLAAISEELGEENIDNY